MVFAFDPFTLAAVTAATAVASAGVGIASAVSQANAAEDLNNRNADYARRTAAANKEQADIEAQDAKRRLARQADTYAAAAIASGETRGALGTTSLDAVRRSISGSGSNQLANILTQLGATKGAIDSGSNPAWLPEKSVFASAFGEGLQGVSSGLALGGSLQKFSQADQVLKTQQATQAQLANSGTP